MDDKPHKTIGWIVALVTVCGSIFLAVEIFEGKSLEWKAFALLTFPLLVITIVEKFAGVGMLLTAGIFYGNKLAALLAGGLAAIWQVLILATNSRNGIVWGLEKPSTELLTTGYLVFVAILWSVAIAGLYLVSLEWRSEVEAEWEEGD